MHLEKDPKELFLIELEIFFNNIVQKLFCKSSCPKN